MDGSKKATPRQGMAIFAVLSLMVVFTVLGVAAITIAQRDNASSGNFLDIKQRESAAYAGLVYAQNELTRDPANFLSILESWRTKKVYASPTGPFVPLYLKFDNTAKVSLSTTDPGMFQIPGTQSKIKVEITGITIPGSAEEPRIALRSTGSSASGDEQTLLGIYQIKNIRRNSGKVTLPITHPIMVSGSGNWDSPISIDGGNGYFGGAHGNGSMRNVQISKGGLRIAGNFTLDDFDTLSIDSGVYIKGDLLVHSVKKAVFKKNVVVGGDLEFSSAGVNLTFNQSLAVLGTAGLPSLQANRIVVGATDPNSAFYLPNGNLKMENGWITVNGSAFIHQIDCPKDFVLDVTKRLELSDNPAIKHTFSGSGAWRQLIVRNVAPFSSMKSQTVTLNPIWGTRNPAFNTGITIYGAGFPGHSWIKDENMAISNGNASATIQIGSKVNASVTPGPWSFSPAVTLGPPDPATISDKGGVDGFETIATSEHPPLISDLGVGTEPSDANLAYREPVVDLTRDPSLVSRGWIAKPSSVCENASNTCAKAIQDAYNANKAGSKSQFYDEFFVVRLQGAKLDWDATGEAVPLQGKFIFLVEADYGGEGAIWPSTAPNPNASNPKNVIFVYAKAGNHIFAGFSPRYKKNTDPVEFTGYVRYDGDCSNPNLSWKPAAPLTVRGAFHVLGPYNGTPGSSECQKFTINSGAAKHFVRFVFDQPALDAIGTSLGTIFKKPDGTGLPPQPQDFLLMENWIQFRTLGELR